VKTLVVLCALTVLAIGACRSSSDGQTVESPEKGSEPVPAGQAWEIGENWRYGSHAISGDLLVALEMETEGFRVVARYISIYNLRTRDKTRVLKVPADRTFGVPAIHGDRVVWASLDRSQAEQQPSPQNQGILNWDVFLLDLSTGEIRQLTTEEHAQVHPAIYGDTVVWLDRRHGNNDQYPSPYDVYAYDLKTGKETRLTSDTTAEGYDQVSISGNLVAWTDIRHAAQEVTSHPSNAGDYNNEIYLYDLSTGREMRVTANPANDHYPAVDGGRVTWLRQYDYREADVFVYDIKTGRETQVSTSRYAAFRPAIRGDFVAWTDARVSKGNTNNDVIEIDATTGERREPAADIYLYNLRAQHEVALTSAVPLGSGFPLWVRPVMSGGFVVYELNRQVGPIVYATRMADEAAGGQQ